MIATRPVPSHPVQVLHALPGRLRLHLPGWSGNGSRDLEKHVRALGAVRRVEANPVTRNVLVEFDPGGIDRQAVLAAVAQAEGRTAGTEQEDAPLPPVIREPAVGRTHRVRIPVRGLDRDPELARHVVDRLQQVPSVKARANPLTGRVLVEFDASMTELRELLTEVADVELPPLPDEPPPGHPLDPAPLIQSSLRTAGAVLGLMLVAGRRLTGATQPLPGTKVAAVLSTLISALRGFPTLRSGMRQLLGHNTADVVFSTANAATLAYVGSPLGLAVIGVESALLLRMVLARRAVWLRYEQRVGGKGRTEPGAVLRLEAGDRTPRAAVVEEGTGTALGRDGLPIPLRAGAFVPAGARILGGPLVVTLQAGQRFTPRGRPAPPRSPWYQQYVHWLEPAAFGYAILTAALTRSLTQTLKAIVLVNPRAAVIGMEAATLNASARVLRAGVTVVGTRRDRHIQRPDAVLLDGPRVLTDGLEVTHVIPLEAEGDPAVLLNLAAGVAGAAGSPWGNAFLRGHGETDSASFDGSTAQASIEGVRYTLGFLDDATIHPEAVTLQQRGYALLALQRGDEAHPLALFALRPRLRDGVAELVALCQRFHIELALLPGEDDAATQALARRARVALAEPAEALSWIRRQQARGERVAFVSDSATAAHAFAACDLAIGLSSGRSSRFPARADLLAHDLGAIAAILEAGTMRDRVVRDSTILSLAGNLFSAIWGLRNRPPIERISLPTYVAALLALGDGLLRLAGGQIPGAARLLALADPRPERWGRRSVENALKALQSRAEGLTATEARRRQIQAPRQARRHELFSAIMEQLRMPTTGILAGAAGFSLFLGQPLDVAVIGLTIGVNVLVGAWQERQAGRAAEALKKLSSRTARVLRDGKIAHVRPGELVVGDILLLAAGDRVAADARLLQAHGLEVDEAALTGESLPVSKRVGGGAAETHIVLEGSDVVVGAGKAVVVAVGQHTRLGAISTALTADDAQQSPLGARLSRLLWQSLPLTAAASVAVVAAGTLRGQPLVPQLTVGASLALAAVPEGLPLLAGMGQAGVARRLARRRALVCRLSAVEALGRVDVACTDKTGTLTEGRLQLQVVADLTADATLPAPLSQPLQHVLLTAGLASPHPESAGAAAHPTDVAVLRGAESAGLGDAVRQSRQAEMPFDPVRSFHAAIVAGRLCIKGAPEAVLKRSARLRRHGRDESLDDVGRQAVLDRARILAEQGLRVLLVAENTAAAAKPEELTVLGFVGIRDPLRAGVQAAVQRCQAAGVRVVMITGDHPATARTIAREAGLSVSDAEVVTGPELAEMENGILEQRLRQVSVIARATPLDKLRIIEGLQRLGHTVAMTGDGVNDAPALRLADVGVAMGQGGTEVARQAADVVLADDDFATLVEALVEGRGFWQNIRRALGLLLGGNLGELGLISGASVFGLSSPLTARQILFVNLLTDALPAMSVVLQHPEHRNLAGLTREGVTALDTALRRDVLRRGLATAGPALAAHLLARGANSLGQARTVAFASIVATQLAQTLDVGWTEGRLDRSVFSSVTGSAGVLAAVLTVPPLRQLLGLALPAPLSWGLIGGAALGAVGLSRLLALSRNGTARLEQPAVLPSTG